MAAATAVPLHLRAFGGRIMELDPLPSPDSPPTVSPALPGGPAAAEEVTPEKAVEDGPVAKVTPEKESLDAQPEKPQPTRCGKAAAVPPKPAPAVKRKGSSSTSNEYIGLSALVPGWTDLSDADKRKVKDKLGAAVSKGEVPPRTRAPGGRWEWKADEPRLPALRSFLETVLKASEPSEDIVTLVSENEGADVAAVERPVPAEQLNLDINLVVEGSTVTDPPDSCKAEAGASSSDKVSADSTAGKDSKQQPSQMAASPTQAEKEEAQLQAWEAAVATESEEVQLQAWEATAATAMGVNPATDAGKRRDGPEASPHAGRSSTELVQDASPYVVEDEPAALKIGDEVSTIDCVTSSNRRFNGVLKPETSGKVVDLDESDNKAFIDFGEKGKWWIARENWHKLSKDGHPVLEGPIEHSQSEAEAETPTKPTATLSKKQKLRMRLFKRNASQDGLANGQAEGQEEHPRAMVCLNLRGERVLVPTALQESKAPRKILIPWADLEASDLDAMSIDDIYLYEKELGLSTLRPKEDRLKRLEQLAQKTTLPMAQPAADQPSDEAHVQTIAEFLALPIAERRDVTSIELKRLERLAFILDGENLNANERRSRLVKQLWESKAKAPRSKESSFLSRWASRRSSAAGAEGSKSSTIKQSKGLQGRSLAEWASRRTSTQIKAEEAAQKAAADKAEAAERRKKAGVAREERAAARRKQKEDEEAKQSKKAASTGATGEVLGKAADSKEASAKEPAVQEGRSPRNVGRVEKSVSKTRVQMGKASSKTPTPTKAEQDAKTEVHERKGRGRPRRNSEQAGQEAAQESSKPTTPASKSGDANAAASSCGKPHGITKGRALVKKLMLKKSPKQASLEAPPEPQTVKPGCLDAWVRGSAQPTSAKRGSLANWRRPEPTRGSPQNKDAQTGALAAGKEVAAAPVEVAASPDESKRQKRARKSSPPDAEVDAKGTLASAATTEPTGKRQKLARKTAPPDASEPKQALPDAAKGGSTAAGKASTLNASGTVEVEREISTPNASGSGSKRRKIAISEAPAASQPPAKTAANASKGPVEAATPSRKSKQPRLKETPAIPAGSAVDGHWRIVFKGDLRVRAEKSTESAVRVVKHSGAVVSGTQEGDWIKLADGEGYMLARKSDGTSLLEKCDGSSGV